jgi:spermidine synthase
MDMRHIMRVAVSSFVLLFLELLFIRVIGTEIRIFAYVSNLVLLLVYVSAGAGMFVRRQVSLLCSVAGLALLTVLLSAHVFLSVTDLLAPLYDSVVWYSMQPASLVGIFVGTLQLLVLMALVIVIFVPIGAYLGSQLEGKSTAVAMYAVNLMSSVMGLWAMNVLSFFRISPYVGLMIGEALLFAITSNSQRKQASYIVIMMAIAVGIGMQKDTAIWSPYQKLDIIRDVYSSAMPAQFTVTVNDVGYMGLLDLSRAATASYDEKLRKEGVVSESELAFQNLYDMPYRIRPNAKRVLIIGAGGGNDAAAALRAGVERIDVVEIDPVIISLGKMYHPEHPYEDSRVHIQIDDGRAALTRATSDYDIIVMGYADAHTTNSSLTNIQLDNYLYTEESFQSIKRLLARGGILYLSFGAYRPWVVGRLQNTLAAAFLHPPVVFSVENSYSGGGAYFITSRDEQELRTSIAGVTGLSDFIMSHRENYSASTAILRDDWPYMYLENPGVPMLHLLIWSFLALTFILFMKYTTGFGAMHWTSFYLGAAFLLYEFQNVTRSSLLFGNTWATNLYTISAVLLYNVAATWVYQRYSAVFPALRSFRVLYSALFLSLILEASLPLGIFSGLSYVGRIVLASAYLSLPLFVSGLIFIHLLHTSSHVSRVYASNFIGAFFGGLLSLLSYAYGLHALLYVGMLLYVLAMLHGHRDA